MNTLSEQLLIYAETELIDKESIRRAVLKGRRRHEGIAWKRILLPVAACLVLVCGTVLLIPSARAEVFRWFGISRPQEYLTTDPSERPDIPELNALIASPAAEDVVTVPIDRTESEAVNSEHALAIAAFLHENCDVALGDAMYDGQRIYQTVRLNGLSGLYLLEQYTGTYATAIMRDGFPAWPSGWIVYELPDGTQFFGIMDLTDAIEPYSKSLNELGLRGANAPEDAKEQIDAKNRQYLTENGLAAVAEVVPHDIERYLDENGNLTAKVLYRVTLTEQDDRPDTELYTAQIGTITVNMRAYQSVEAGKPVSAGAVRWDAETVTLSKLGVESDCLAFSRLAADTEGLVMTAETDETEIGLLGVKNLRVRITLPEAWTQAQREAFAKSLQFAVLIDGEAGDWYPQYVYCEVQDDGSVLWSADELYGVPYDVLGAPHTLTLIPQLFTYETVTLTDGQGNPLPETLAPAIGETAISEPGTVGFNAATDVAAFPQYAITLYVN